MQIPLHDVLLEVKPARVRDVSTLALSPAGAEHIARPLWKWPASEGTRIANLPPGDYIVHPDLPRPQRVVPLARLSIAAGGRSVVVVGDGSRSSTGD
jgi:hypothetical protein